MTNIISHSSWIVANSKTYLFLWIVSDAYFCENSLIRCSMVKSTQIPTMPAKLQSEQIGEICTCAICYKLFSAIKRNMHSHNLRQIICTIQIIYTNLQWNDVFYLLDRYVFTKHSLWSNIAFQIKIIKLCNLSKLLVDSKGNEKFCWEYFKKLNF